MIHEKRDEKWRLWTHAALMAGREFCYSLEIVSVTPVMKTLGLPDQEKFSECSRLDSRTRFTHLYGQIIFFKRFIKFYRPEVPSLNFIRVHHGSG